MDIILTNDDINYIKQKYPNLTINAKLITWDITFIVEYKWTIITDTYKIVILLETRQNSILPIVRDIWWRIDKIAEKYNKKFEDIHVNRDKSFCLTIDKIELDYFTNRTFNIPDFFEKVLEPYLYWMSFFEKNWRFPFWEYSHWYLWYIELFDEWKLSLEELINVLNENWKDIKNCVNMKWHHLCICWSWDKIRNCHPTIFSAFYKLKKIYEPKKFSYS
jgi:hypothetical protein